MKLNLAGEITVLSPRCWALLFVGGIFLAGCSREAKPPPEAQTNLHKLAVLYGQYIAGNRGQPPPDEQTFKKFIRSLPPERLANYKVSASEVDKLFASPRDSQPYVFRYNVGGGVGSPDKPPVLAYEKTGESGRRYVAFTNTKVEEVDDARFRELVPDAK